MATKKLKWTGHALVDVGVAGVCAFTNRSPEGVTPADLDKVSDFISSNFFSGHLDSYLTVVFTNNSGYCGPNKVDPEQYSDVFRAHRVRPRSNVAQAQGVDCAFSGEPADAWVHRQHLPLFSADGVINFRPEGQVAVPIADMFLVALQFVPMAARKAEGGMLFVHAEKPELTLRFAKKFLEDNLRILAFSMPAEPNLLVDERLPRERLNYDKARKRYKTPDVKGPRSLVISDLTEIGSDVSDFEGSITPLTVYLLSNSGQGPSLQVFDIPGGVVGFVLKAGGATTRAAWSSVARRFSDLNDRGDEVGRTAVSSKDAKASRRKPISGRAGWSRNPAFEDLCAIYDAGFPDRNRARAWLSRYVLGRMKPDVLDSSFENTNARNWALAELFLREVLGMKQARIEAVRAFADKLAEWIRNKNDTALYRSLMMDKPSDVRHSLMRAQRASAAAVPLFGLDEYATVWLHEDGDEWLVRDLICIRVVEALSGAGFFRSDPGLLPEELENTEVKR
jgi:hypothetical protein